MDLVALSYFDKPLTRLIMTVNKKFMSKRKIFRRDITNKYWHA